jgi:lipopolysaccharide export LptBFGC system permease protein LptF
MEGANVRLKPRTGAVILIVLGVLFLLSNLGLLPRLGPLFAQWWPLILIAVGVYLLVQR